MDPQLTIKHLISGNLIFLIPLLFVSPYNCLTLHTENQRLSDLCNDLTFQNMIKGPADTKGINTTLFV